MWRFQTQNICNPTAVLEVYMEKVVLSLVDLGCFVISRR